MGRNSQRTTKILLGLALSALVIPASASAQDAEWYTAAGGTVSIRGSEPGTIANAPMPGQTVQVEEDYDPGFGGFLALGRDLGRFRVEGEFGYTRDAADRYTAIVPPTGQIFADIETQTFRAMANAYVDFKMGGLEPYVGAGIGYAWSDLSVIAPRAGLPTEQPRRLIDDNDDGFAYQAIAGVALPVSERLRMTLAYRWFDEGQFEGVDGRGEAITRERGAHNVDVGLRWSF
ncbi:outer membrane beta-barrel protein [bacterium]|nr:outer membrane beta-barrel protein [bacterium]